ncbi:hypothetical protein E4P40_13225 [Blastococcus sp. CT_GayMR20]|uniref:hypothetical protein n=1 Tax=Blastococcus sp. CT_GayMR20 TaxID=2559609 RepID=UPI001074171A|nr:hypothetical protein [Blastococcus sp. CT_GayMR20]TFV86198.1 hypothetical protein E4P40_13050 [Blastococcus sp. CT_GayMR20]TFV86229.1 hypothetical protein E4P40_13225 [Blastococcus sp. CT_GayMR20]
MPRAGTYASRRDRLAEVMELNASGLSVTSIAARLGIRSDYAARLLSEGINALPTASVEDLRTATELRLDRIAGVWSELLSDPDPKVRAQAAEGLRRTEADRSRLLGLWVRPPKDED